jgi:hypothetical protein
MSGTLVNDKTNERIGAGRAAELLRNTEWLLCFSPARVLGHGTAIRKLSGTYESCLVCCCAPSFRNLEEILALGQNTNHTRPQFGGSIQQKSLTWTESGPNSFGSDTPSHAEMLAFGAKHKSNSAHSLVGAYAKFTGSVWPGDYSQQPRR